MSECVHDALVGTLKRGDAWFEFKNQWHLYSTTYDIAIRENEKLRYLCLVDINVDMRVHYIGRIDYPILTNFITALSDITAKTERTGITTSSTHTRELRVCLQSDDEMRLDAEPVK
mgnify:CR=1 FL=1